MNYDRFPPRRQILRLENQSKEEMQRDVSAYGVIRDPQWAQNKDGLECEKLVMNNKI